MRHLTKPGLGLMTVGFLSGMVGSLVALFAAWIRDVSSSEFVGALALVLAIVGFGVMVIGTCVMLAGLVMTWGNSVSRIRKDNEEH